jgi:hypothetical protein
MDGQCVERGSFEGGWTRTRGKRAKAEVKRIPNEECGTSGAKRQARCRPPALSWQVLKRWTLTLPPSTCGRQVQAWSALLSGCVTYARSSSSSSSTEISAPCLACIQMCMYRNRHVAARVFFLSSPSSPLNTINFKQITTFTTICTSIRPELPFWCTTRSPPLYHIPVKTQHAPLIQGPRPPC